MTRSRLEALQWFGLVGGPIAFALEHVVNVETVLAHCNPVRVGVPTDAVLLAVTAAAALVVVLAEGAALLAFRATQDVDYEGEPPLGRIRFLSTAALAVGPLFLVLVLLSGLGAVAQPTCRPS